MLAVPLSAWPAPERGRVVVAREPDRAKAVAACLDALEFRACEGRDVALKANFNSDDAFPASTHPDTLAALIAALIARRAGVVTLAERSGMGDTRSVLDRTGAAEVVRRAGGRVIILDEVGRPAWESSRAAPGVFLASDDRCALDAAAIALLRQHGMKGPAASGPIARTDQLARALALGIGAAPNTVDVVPASPAAGDVAKRLADALAQG